MARDDENDASGPPPHPLDRVWFHPTEMRSFRAATRPATMQPRQLVAGGAVGVVGAALLGLFVLALVGGFDQSENRVLTSSAGFSDPTATEDLVTTASASVVGVRVTRADGVTRASGICVEGGQVVTSALALEGATGVAIVTGSGRSMPVTVAGTDPETGLALLRYEGGGVPPARLGSSQGLRRGEPVLAVAAGSKPGRNWVSVGEVTAFDRLLVTGSGTAIAGLIDTATGAGGEQSGGAVLDESGKLVAILAVPAGQSSSGLALPAEVARDVTGQLAATGRVTHGWLGVMGTDDVDRAGGGARIEKVLGDSPAERAGLTPGDVIVAVADEKSTTSVSNMAELMTEVRRRRPGEILELSVLRDGGARKVPIALSDRSSGAAADAFVPSTSLAPSNP